MTPTVHQRVHLWLWHWPNIDNAQLRKMYDAGARVLCVQLQDDGPVLKRKVTEWKEIGFIVWGAVRPANDPLHAGTWTPQEVVTFASQEKQRLGLNGMRFNIEDDGRFADISSGGQWSEQLALDWRLLYPNLATCIDTYYGAAAGGLNLGAYVKRGFRMNVQSYWGTEGIYDDPVPRIVKWCAGANPPISKSIVKPGARVSKNNFGARLDRKMFVDDCLVAGTKGLYLYYVDGALEVLDEYLVPFVRDAVSRGAAY